MVTIRESTLRKRKSPQFSSDATQICWRTLLHSRWRFRERVLLDYSPFYAWYLLVQWKEETQMHFLSTLYIYTILLIYLEMFQSQNESYVLLRFQYFYKYFNGVYNVFSTSSNKFCSWMLNNQHLDISNQWQSYTYWERMYRVSHEYIFII